MKDQNPVHTVKKFNEYINKKDLNGLDQLMAEDHVYIDRDGARTKTKDIMLPLWKQFFELFPDYQNTFTRIESASDLVKIVGYAFWSEAQPLDNIIWTVRIKDNLIQEWRTYDDTENNRRLLNLS